MLALATIFGVQSPAYAAKGSDPVGTVKTLGELGTDELVEFITFLNEPVVWRVIDHNHTGFPENSTTLITDQIVALRPFDGKELNKNHGNKDYTVSNIRQWLNSSAGAGEWYSPQHEYDAPPSKANINYYNAYEDDPGFLNGATPQERELLLDTDRKIGGITITGITCTDKVFLLTTDEFGLETVGAANGTKIPYFADNNARQATVTTACVTDSDFNNDPVANKETWPYWTATSYSSSNSSDVSDVTEHGTRNHGDAYYGEEGVRPACNLRSDTGMVKLENGHWKIVDSGNITISKQVTGNAADATKDFTFTVKLTKDGEPVHETFDDVAFDEHGEATIKLHSGQQKEITGLPAGAQYEVYETDATSAGYTTSVETTEAT